MVAAQHVRSVQRADLGQQDDGQVDNHCYGAVCSRVHAANDKGIAAGPA